jgi:GT2 family glycosyltransferase
MPGLDIHLPKRFADGRKHRIAVRNERGENLSVRPPIFVAFPDGLERTIAGFGDDLKSERLRGELFDRLGPMARPFSEYENWRRKFPFVSDESVAMHAAVVTVGHGQMEDTLASLQAQTHADWDFFALPPTESTTGFEPNLVRDVLHADGRRYDLVVFGLTGAVFHPNALERFASSFQDFPDSPAAYADVDLVDTTGSVLPIAFSAFDYERMLEQGDCAHLFALRHSVAEQCLAKGASNLYRLFNAVLDDDVGLASAIIHIPGALANLPPFDHLAAASALAEATRDHLEVRGRGAHIIPSAGTIFPAVHVARDVAAMRTTIIIPTRNKQALLQSCIESIRPAMNKNQAEVIVVDNGSDDPETLRYLEAIKENGTRILRIVDPFNYAQLNNRAVDFARGEVLCLLNNDIKALDDDWLEEMLGRLVEADVGAVGAMLLWPSGVVQHGGVVLGPLFAATHAFNQCRGEDPGYGDLLKVAHECSAVTGACLVTRRADYIAVGGLDEVRFPINFNDVDYCLKLRAAGKRVVFTPHAKLLHYESASRGVDSQPDQRSRSERELQNLRAKWGDVLADDPLYSPVLSVDPLPFSALAWPARELKPRTCHPLVPAEVPPGF